MIVQIIPAKRMPIHLPFLDYTVPEALIPKIKVGQLVKIPFRNKSEFGVIFSVISTSSEKKAKLKAIDSIIFEKIILSQTQLSFLKDISDFYHVSLGFLLKNNLLPLQKRKLQKLQLLDDGLSVSTDKNIPRYKPELLIYKNKTEKSKAILDILSAAEDQTLVLVPEMTSIEKIKSYLPADILKNAVEISSELSPKELFDRWVQIWSREKNIIIGTRTALFLPWFNLKNIILDDEGNPNYKSWDMAPRLHTRDAALFLATNHGAKLKMLTHSPSVETLFFAQKKVYNGVNLDLKTLSTQVQTIDMRAERRIKNFSLLSHDVLHEYQKTQAGDVVFFINRRGTVSYIGCRDCGNVLKCPTCQLSLTYHQNNNSLVCHYCKHLETMPLQCKKCHGTNVNMYGAGTQLAEGLIKKIITKGDLRPAVRVDGDKADLNKLKQPGDKIIICTQLAWTHLDWNKIKLLVFLDADSSLFVPEYKISEDLWQQLRDAQFNLNRDAVLAIQTNHPEHVVFASLFDPNFFYKQQIEERRMLGYPPFKFLLKIAVGNQKEDALLTEVRSITNKLDQLTKNLSDITIMGPWEASPYRLNGQYWQVILAKINYENYKKNTKLLASNLPDSCKIDPNPNSILSFS